MSKRSKNHHFVPIVLQKQFASEQDAKRIWFAEKEKVFRAPELKKFEKAFYKRNYHTVLLNDGPSDIIEKKFYGQIDNFFGKFLPAVAGAIEAGQAPNLSYQSVESIRMSVFEMVKRSPEFSKKYDDLEVGKQALQEILTTLSENGKYDERDKQLKAYSNDHRLRELGRDIRNRAILPMSDQMKNALGERDIRWAVSKTKNSFILSSLLVYRIGNGGRNGLINPNSEIWMPISPKICLILLKDPFNMVPLVNHLDAKKIREINEFAAQNSSQIGSHSQRLIESITRQKASLG